MSEPNNFLLEMHNISKEFPGVKALDEVDFDLKSGEIHALVGENGAGKSTLIKILSGIYQSEDGGISIKFTLCFLVSPLQIRTFFRPSAKILSTSAFPT